MPGAHSDDGSIAVVNARVWTGDARRPWADGVAVRDGRLLAVGSAAEVRKVAADARVVDAAGALVGPGALAAPAAGGEAAGRGATIERGGVADFVLLDRALGDVAATSIGAARVRLAVVAGRVAFDADAR